MVISNDLSPLLDGYLLRFVAPVQVIDIMIELLNKKGGGIHWPHIDEDLSIAGLLAGAHQSSSAETLLGKRKGYRPLFPEIILIIFFLEKNILSSNSALNYMMWEIGYYYSR